MQEKYTENPEIVTYVDAEQGKLKIEISILDVEKEDIKIMMDENGYFVSALSEGGVEYVAAAPFLRAVKPAEAKAVYEESYLRIEVPFRDPLENYVNVPVE